MLIVEKVDVSGECCKMERMINSYTPTEMPSIFKMSDEQTWNNKIVETQEKKRLERTYDEEIRFNAYVRQKKMEEEARVRARANRWQ